MNSFWTNPLTNILFGWLLGLLSPHLVELVQKRIRRSSVKKSLLLEMEDLRLKLAMRMFKLVISTGTMDRAFLDWIGTVLRSYDEAEVDVVIRTQIEELGHLTDQQLISIPAKAEIATILKQWSLPLLASQIASLGMFPLDFQKNLLQIGSSVDLMNKESEQVWYMYTSTFNPSVSAPNWDRLDANIRTSYLRIINQCRDLINSIDYLSDRQISPSRT